ncbi:D-2-hydroxyacid dehydrogenase [Candidatus Laterigemmans baculatus]|uniref:D-2-hydroxyacid dehydrogenase n=1 Tax=Candidatus Laterigemmans baculatus TaxID=2770505 RepID=UPI0013D977A0|nr:D-2-hydroxyacid dehydrogenase [Candidatus Laterigemmans baculatus]
MRIVLCFPVEPKHIEAIRRAAPAGAEIVDAGQERVDEELPSADIFIGHAKVPVDWDRVLAAGRLQWIQSSAAGLDHCLVPGVIDSEIVVTSASGLFAPQVTEQTLALLLGLIRSLPTFMEATRRREFIRRPTDDLRGKTVGIVGLGGNGRCISRALAPLCERIIATDYFPHTQPREVDQLWSADLVDRLVGESDVVILTLPLNAQTHHYFDAARIAKMRPGSYLINVARGPVVEEAALVEALESGHLRGAGLDVTEVEPLPGDSRLWECPQVIITPHVGAQSARRVDDTVRLVCENLSRWQAGEPLYNRVDKRLGFPNPDTLWNA